MEETPDTAALSAAEVAAAAGVDVAELDRLVAAGVVVGDEDGWFAASDIARVRLVRSLIASGVSLDDMAHAVSAGRLSFEYVGQLMPDPVRLVAPPADAIAGPSQWERLFEPILGTNRSAGEPVREDDFRLYEMAERANQIGIPPERVVRLVRTFAQAVARLIDTQREFVDEVLLAPSIAETGSPMAALEATSAARYEYRRLGRATVLNLLDRGMDDAIFRNMVQLTELILDAGGVDQTRTVDGVAFIDISDYSRLSELRGDDDAAAQASTLGAVIQDLARDHGGRMVKSLGDGALVHAPTADGVLAVALDAVGQAEERGLWPLHAGVNVGRVVTRDGDLFGSAVNVASRLAEQATAGQVVVSRAVIDLVDGDLIDAEPAGVVDLKNISEPVELFVATRRR